MDGLTHKIFCGPTQAELRIYKKNYYIQNM